MILVTVGMQLGFDRLIKVMDELAPTLEQPVIAQSGKGSFKARHMEQHRTIAADQFEALAQTAHLIISHAGIGTVLTAKRLSKPIVLFPRRASLGEHRNDHQLATCRQLEQRPGIHCVFEEHDLLSAIQLGLKTKAGAASSPPATAQLEAAIATFIATGTI